MKISVFIQLRVMNFFLILDLENCIGQVANVKAAAVQDDLGLGGLFPMPVGTDEELLVGSFSLLDMEEKIISPELKACLKQADEEGNPVLVFYNLK